MARLSACLIVKDEATNLPRCLRSIRAVARTRLVERLGTITPGTMREIEDALALILGIHTAQDRGKPTARPPS